MEIAHTQFYGINWEGFLMSKNIFFCQSWYDALKKILLSCFYWLLTFTAMALNMSYMRLRGKKFNVRNYCSSLKLHFILCFKIKKITFQLLLSTESAVCGLSQIIFHFQWTATETKKIENKNFGFFIVLFYFIFPSHPFRIITVCAIHLIRCCWTFQKKCWNG